MTKKRGLGKGLEALIPTGAAAAAAQWGEMQPEQQTGVRMVPLDNIDPNPHQPRSPIDREELEQLATSIKEHGLIQPVIVTKSGSRYQLIAGERRWRAAELAELQMIPVIIKEVTPQQMLELALVENIQRADLNVLEEAAAFRQLMDEFGLTQEQVAERVGKSRPAVANIVRLLTLPKSIQAAILQKKISEGHGRALLRLSSPEAQKSALDVIMKRDLSVRQAEELVGRLAGQPRPVKRRPISPEIVTIQNRLQRRLGTRVNILHGKTGGRIVIHYYSNEELDSIIDQIGLDE
ncbi:MAG: ParB/RepB/Spo0J family partition protein [Anaerolineales bacterium]|nr:ParB/RepB/Spo0J family partition protein [Anaerolineales bacterium]